MKNFKYTIGFFLAAILLFSSCSNDANYSFGDIIAPSNVQIIAEIVGADADNPFGDGSGTVNFTATSSNVITYKFIQNGEESMAPAGTKTYNFGTTGTHTYAVTVLAIGTGGISSSATIEVEVLALYAAPADLLTMLTADSSRTWRIKAEGSGHFGVGPADADSPIWWGAVPNDKAGKGAYDDRFTFNLDGTFTHVTNLTAYGKADPMTQDLIGDQGLTANGDAEFENYPLPDYSENWSLSAPGGQETLQLSGIGYLGFYVGASHSYTILSRSENEMSLRTVGAGGLGWFVILVAE
ncbi:MAG: glucan endo-1,3-beta-D-glucosidase [Flavobacteriales bacterium]|nr:glucan endo-1,3-beta-D-glucosidase [Flavobacteriales bacterium]